MIRKIQPAEMPSIEPVLRSCRYDRVIIDSVLEGNFGEAYTDSSGSAVRMDSGAFTILAGDPESESLKDLLGVGPVYYVTPQNRRWEEKLVSIYGNRAFRLPFTEFSSHNIDRSRLSGFIAGLSEGFELRKINAGNAEKVADDLENEYFFENFHSIDDYVSRGAGFCIIHKGKAVAAASSMAQSSRAVDIEIETAAGYRRQGLGTIAGAGLVLHCLERGIEPKWLAANPESEKLAEKLMFSRGECYFTLEIDQ